MGRMRCTTSLMTIGYRHAPRAHRSAAGHRTDRPVERPNAPLWNIGLTRVPELGALPECHFPNGTDCKTRQESGDSVPAISKRWSICEDSGNRL